MKALNQTRNSFSPARFWAYTLRYLDEHKKTLGLGAGVVAGILFFFAIWIGTSELFENEVTTPIDRQMFMVVFEMMIFYGIFGLYSTIMGSMTFNSMKSKKLRISAMMVPAAQSEKYWSMVLIYDILGNLYYLAVVILADFARAAVSHSMNVWDSISFYSQFDSIGGFRELAGAPISVWQVIFAMILFAFLTQAVYVLGSSLWPRNSFIITFCVIFALQMVYALAFDLDTIMHHIDSPSYSAYMLGTMALIAIFYGLAWWRFKSTQLIQLFMKS